MEKEPLSSMALSSSDPSLSLENIRKEILLFVETELKHLSKEVENQIVGLSSQFMTLADSAQSQGAFIEGILKIASSVELEGKETNLSEMAFAIDKKLAHVLGAMINISKETMQVIFYLNNIVDRTKVIYSFMDKIDEISGKTNMLAINAAIEAARSNESGQTFKVIASEITHLSQATRDLSVAMRKELTEIAEGIQESYVLMGKYASVDMSQYINQRENLEIMMNSLMNRSSQLTEMLTTTKNVSNQVATEIKGMIFTIQFQDRFRQNMENICYILDQLIQSRAPSESPESDPEKNLKNIDEFLILIIKSCTLGDLRQKLASHFEKFNHLPQLKEFIQSIENDQKEPTAQTDNIDLF